MCLVFALDTCLRNELNISSSYNAYRVGYAFYVALGQSQIISSLAIRGNYALVKRLLDFHFMFHQCIRMLNQVFPTIGVVLQLDIQICFIHITNSNVLMQIKRAYSLSVDSHA